MTVRLGPLLRASADRLQVAGCDAPRLDARLLLAEVTGWSDAVIVADRDREVTEEMRARFEILLQRREQREPVSKILGKREFWSLPFEVTPDTLDPRPDSETLVEWVLALFPDQGPIRLIDFGTGTGCLLLALLHERPNWRGTGVDICQNALLVAERNAHRLNLSDRADFSLSHWDESLSDQSLDLIVSNPPYIARDEMANLSDEVRRFDPEIALTDGADGLVAYHRLAAAALRFLKPGGHLVVEHGATQHDRVAAIFTRFGLKPLGGKKDLGGHVRCTAAERTG